MNSDNNAFMTPESIDGSFDFHEIGLNANWNLHDQWRLQGQVISQKIGEMNDGDPQIDFLLVEYALRQVDYSVDFRLGRIKTPYGLLNSLRDVPSLRTGLMIPTSIYLEGLRDMMLSTDGIGLVLVGLIIWVSLSWTCFGGIEKLTGRFWSVNIWMPICLGARLMTSPNMV